MIRPPPGGWTWPRCVCGHHAVMHNLKGERRITNPHLADPAERPWKVDAQGGLRTDHCAGTLEDGCACSLYCRRAVSAPVSSGGGRAGGAH